jgi:hypothetical protein
MNSECTCNEANIGVACNPRGQNISDDLLKVAERVSDIRHDVKNLERAIVGEEPEQQAKMPLSSKGSTSISQTMDAIFYMLGSVDSSISNLKKGIWG